MAPTAFDVPDAALAAGLYMEGKSAPTGKAKVARKYLRADSMVIASAVGHGAREFYTDDKRCHAMASKVMNAKKLPDMPPNLYEYK